MNTPSFSTPTAPAPWGWVADLTQLQMDMALHGSQAMQGNVQALGSVWQDMAMATLKMQSAMLSACLGRWVDPEAVLAGATVLE